MMTNLQNQPSCDKLYIGQAILSMPTSTLVYRPLYLFFLLHNERKVVTFQLSDFSPHLAARGCLLWVLQPAAAKPTVNTSCEPPKVGQGAYVGAERGWERMLSGTQWSGEGSVCRSGTQWSRHNEQSGGHSERSGGEKAVSDRVTEFVKRRRCPVIRVKKGLEQIWPLC